MKCDCARDLGNKLTKGESFHVLFDIVWDVVDLRSLALMVRFLMLSLPESPRWYVWLFLNVSRIVISQTKHGNWIDFFCAASRPVGMMMWECFFRCSLRLPAIPVIGFFFADFRFKIFFGSHLVDHCVCRRKKRTMAKMLTKMIDKDKELSADQSSE